MNASLYRGMPYTLVASAAQTTSSNSGVLSGTSQLPCASAVSLFLNVTAFTGILAGSTGLAVYVDISPDGGTTWFAVEKFATVVSSTGTQLINFRTTGLGAVEAAAQSWIMSTTSSIAVATNVVFPATQRVRWTLPDNTTGAHSATFSVTAIVQPMGSTIV